MNQRVRIIHPHDIFNGKIGYVIEKVDQHSLFTYIVFVCGEKRAYQRNEIKFLKPTWRVKK